MYVRALEGEAPEVTVFVVAFALLLLLTGVHEAGHWLAIRAKGGRALRLTVGRGPVVVRRSGPPELRVGLLPFGGKIAFEGVPTRRGRVVVALGGAAANLVLAMLAFGLGALALDLSSVTPGTALAEGPVGFVSSAVGGWFWLIPGAIGELLLLREPGAVGPALRFLVRLMNRTDPAALVYLTGSASALWASLNLIPVPGIGTDGWRALMAIFRSEGGTP